MIGKKFDESRTLDTVIKKMYADREESGLAVKSFPVDADPRKPHVRDVRCSVKLVVGGPEHESSLN